MAEEAKPVVESTPEVKPVTSSTTTVEQKKSGSALPKILIILVVVICACVVCAVAAYFVFVTFLSKATSSLNSAIVNEVMNSAYNSTSGSTTTTPTGNSTTNSTDSGVDDFSWGTSIPSTFPTDIPIYAGAESSFSSSDRNTDGKMETSVTFALKGNATDVVNFYKSQMVTAGYSLQSEANFFGSVLSFENAQREVIVSVIGSEDSQDVVLSLIVTEK